MKILLVFAHPDDESFSCSGTLIKLVSQGAQISLITATYGQMGLSAEIQVSSPEELGEIRKKELQEVAKIIGIKKIHFFGLMDGQLFKYPLKTLVKKILPIMGEESPDVVITFDKKGGSNHPDHIKISKAATDAFGEYMKRVKKYVRLYHTVTPRSYYAKYKKAGLANTGFGTPNGVLDSQITTRVDISDVFDQKMRVLACHKTQMKDVDRYKKRGELVDLKVEFFKLIAENGFKI